MSRDSCISEYVPIYYIVFIIFFIHHDKKIQNLTLSVMRLETAIT